MNCFCGQLARYLVGDIGYCTILHMDRVEGRRAFISTPEGKGRRVTLGRPLWRV